MLYRSREAAGRRNWPEAVPKKMRAEKGRRLTKLSENRDEEQTAKLLVTQGDDGIDVGGAPGGDVAGGEGDQPEKQSNRQKCK
jgi:hypothetical protein